MYWPKLDWLLKRLSHTCVRTALEPPLFGLKHVATHSARLLKPALCTGIVFHRHADKRLFTPDTGDLLPVRNTLLTS